MKRLNFLLAFLLLFTSGVNAQGINSSKSVVSFEIGGIGWSTVEGEIKGMSGSLIFDKNNLALSFFNVCVDPKTILTDDEKRDTHLKEPDFFNTTKFSSICFKSTNVSKSKEGYRIKGELTILGISSIALAVGPPIPPPADTPIDGGASIILLGAAAVGIKKKYFPKKED